MKWLYLALTFLVGYLVGSVNLSLVVTKYIGKIDIYKVGSGNAGGTNVARSMGLGLVDGNHCRHVRLCLDPSRWKY